MINLMIISVCIAGFGVFISIIINWKTFFRPDIKLLKERELNAMENLYKVVYDDRIDIPKYVSIEDLGNIIGERGNNLHFIYVYVYNKNVRKNLSNFIKQVIHVQRNEYNNTEKENLKKSHIKLKTEVDAWFDIKTERSFCKLLKKRICKKCCQFV